MFMNYVQRVISTSWFEGIDPAIDFDKSEIALIFKRSRLKPSTDEGGEETVPVEDPDDGHPSLNSMLHRTGTLGNKDTNKQSKGGRTRVVKLCPVTVRVVRPCGCVSTCF